MRWSTKRRSRNRVQTRPAGLSFEQAQILEQIAVSGRRRQEIEDEMDALRPVVHSQVFVAAFAGVSQARICELTGLTRESVRQICFAESRRAKAAAALESA